MKRGYSAFIFRCILLIAVLFTVSCPSGSDSDTRDSADHTYVDPPVALIVSSPSDLDTGECNPVHFAASELTSNFKDALAAGQVINSLIEAETLELDSLLSRISGYQYILIAPGFDDREIYDLAAELSDKGTTVYVFSDKIWPKDSGVVPLSFDYTAAGGTLGARRCSH